MPHDPVTGDPLTVGEYVSWKIQGIIRRWTFLITLSCVTVIVWSTNNSTALVWWNLGASYMALVIESVVGIAMIAQTKRDAVVLREVRDISRRIETIEASLLKDVENIDTSLGIHLND